MTKPNRFIQNSDYLSIANERKLNLSISFPSDYIPDTTRHFRTHVYYGLNVSSGSIINCMYRVNGGDWILGTEYYWERLSQQGSSYTRRVYLSNSTNQELEFTTVTENMATNFPVTVPAITIEYKITFFKPPNLT